MSKRLKIATALVFLSGRRSLGQEEKTWFRGQKKISSLCGINIGHLLGWCYNSTLLLLLMVSQESNQTCEDRSMDFFGVLIAYTYSYDQPQNWALITLISIKSFLLLITKQSKALNLVPQSSFESRSDLILTSKTDQFYYHSCDTSYPSFPWL